MVTASLTDTLSRIGAIGGIIAVVGTGLLILLLASQARQIRDLRDWIDEEPQRQAETTAKVIAEVQRRIAAARERRQAPAPVAPAASAAPPKPPAPGTLGATPEAKAIAAANELVDGPKAAGSVPPPPPAFGAATAAGGAAPKFSPLTPIGGDEDGDHEVDPALDAPINDDEPAVVAEFSGQETQLSDTLKDDEDHDYAPPVSAAAASRRRGGVRYSDEEFDLEDHEEHPRRSKVLFGAGAAVLLAGIVLLATQLFGGSDTKTPSTAGGDNAPAKTTPKPGASTPATVDPATVALRVLNGTLSSGLAGRINDAMKAKGYSVGEPGTASGENSQTASVVYYREGFRPAATQVAKELGLAASAVKPIDTETSVAVGESAEVVVLAGSDLSTTYPASTTG